MKKINLDVLPLVLFLVPVLIFSIIISADPLINWPVNLPKSLSATLGEIRGFSLHQGIDIKTNARSGYPVFAGGRGTVSRLISRDKGYGNAIFIDHGNGFESVYGHLESFEEGKRRLNTLVKTLKVIYNIDDLDFKLTHSNFYFNKDEKIALAGESGSGLPHLHFEIRKNNVFVNPLDYIHIKDTTPPVIENIYVCVEKDNATILETNIKVKKKWGAYTTVNNPVEIEGKKIYFKIACYDRAGAYNRVAIYRIKVYENKKKIFETAFDRLQPGDVRQGPFVYDISKSTIKGGVSYVYVLCRKEGNSYSGIKTLRDGYTNFSNNENQKNISISVSDFAGNEETLNFKIRQKLSGSNQGIGYASIDQKKNTTIQNSDNTIQINIPDNALHADTLMKIEEPVNPEIIAELCKSYSMSGSDLFKTFSVLPHDTIYKKPIKISIKRPSGISDDEIKHIQIFQFFEGRKPGALKTSYSLYQSQFTAESYTNGFFALITDKTPPKIFLPPTFELCEDREIYRNIRLYTSDNLSKINKNSIICIIDGETYPYTFDEDRKWIEVKLPRKVISNGLHHIFAKAFDEAENEAVFRGLLTFE